jgi:hypothetical protein
MPEIMEVNFVRYFVFVEVWGCMSKKIRKVGLVLSFLELYTVLDRAQNPGSHVSTVPHMRRCSRYSVSRFQRSVVRSFL